VQFAVLLVVPSAATKLVLLFYLHPDESLSFVLRRFSCLPHTGQQYTQLLFDI
jgi:hypothetical protein